MSSTDKDTQRIASLFERLFGDPDELAKRPMATDAALAAAQLSATLETAAPQPVPGAGDPIALVAGYLDGGLDENERRQVEASLAASPAELQDAAASRFFLDDIAARPLAAPADLVDAATAALRAVQPVAARRTARWRLGWSVRAWQWSGALAAVLILVAIGVDRIGERAPNPFTTIPNTAGVGPPAETTTVRSEPAPDEGSPEAKAAAASRDSAVEVEQQAVSAASPGAGCPPADGSDVPAATPGTGKVESGMTGNVAGSAPCDAAMNAARVGRPPDAIAGRATGASAGSNYPAAAMPASPLAPPAAPPGSRN